VVPTPDQNGTVYASAPGTTQDVTLDLWTPTAGRRESGIRTGRAATRVSAVSVAR